MMLQESKALALRDRALLAGAVSVEVLPHARRADRFKLCIHLADAAGRDMVSWVYSEAEFRAWLVYDAPQGTKGVS